VRWVHGVYEWKDGWCTKDRLSGMLNLMLIPISNFLLCLTIASPFTKLSHTPQKLLSKETLVLTSKTSCTIPLRNHLSASSPPAQE